MPKNTQILCYNDLKRGRMRKQLNPEKSRKLRPLRVVLAILIAILIVLVLDRLPTSVKDRPTSDGNTSSGQPAPEGSSYYYFYGFLDILEEQTGDRLKELGVSEEDYQNISEHMSKEEINELEAKIMLASKIDNIYVLSDDDSLAVLRQIFKLSDEYSFEKYIRPYATPNEYKDLADLLAEYHQDINTVEDYDAQSE